ncbi:iripin-2 [Parasteatoda tepidariorum]|uniref:iripin-2 n=1 Tax=Parasteatoda tepidariorum TaxID=114398 RepID=UPI0039BC34DD
MSFKLKICGFFLVFFALKVTVSFSEENEQDIKVKVGQLAAANNHLALKLYKQLANGYTKNIFFSPLSLSMAFGMLFHGARDNTIKILRHALGYEEAGLNSEEVSNLFYHLLEEELPPPNTNNSAYILEIANQILVQDGLHLKPAFKEEVESLFHAPIEEVNFGEDGSKVIEKVNHWVEEKTHGKIKKLLEQLDPSAALLLLNAVYFKGTWQTQFKTSATNEQDFYNDGVLANAQQVHFMHLTDKFNYATTNDAQVIELPYKGNNISMMILLPNELDGLSAVEENLTIETIASVRKQLNEQKVILSLPKFEVEYSRDMTGDFKAVGAADVFDGSKANFTGIADAGLYVSQVMHKAAIEVNEEGSEAAAATAIVMPIMAPMPLIPPVVFNANHPFIFAIMDNRNEMIMFAGRVNVL